MAESAPVSFPSADTSPPWPEVRLEVRQGAGRPTAYTVGDNGFLVGTVPGCDLRVPGAELPAVLALVTRRPEGACLRKLSPTAPLQLNGKAVSSALLSGGDRVTVGSLEILVNIQMVSPTLLSSSQEGGKGVAPSAEILAQVEAARQQLHQQMMAFRQEVVRFQKQRDQEELEFTRRQEALRELAAALDQRQHELEERSAELESDRVCWYQRREQIEKELEQQRAEVERFRQELEQQAGPPAPPSLVEREKAVVRKEQELQEQRAALDNRSADLDRQRQELADMRQELADIRRQLYERYQERRDRLAGLQEAVNRAARKVQEQKQQLAQENRTLAQEKQQHAEREAELQRREQELAERQRQLDQEQQQLDQRWQECLRELGQRQEECLARERQLQSDRQKLEQDQAQYQADLVRLDRLQGKLDERERELQGRLADLEVRATQLHEEGQRLETQVVQLNDWHNNLRTLAEQLARQKAEQEAEAARLVQQLAVLEGQQTTLTGLRSRLERMREEVRAAEQQLASDRERIEVQEKEVQERLHEAHKLRAELDHERAALDHDRQQLAERSSVLEAAVAQLRQAQERLAAAEERLRQQTAELDARAAEQAETASLLQARTTHCEEMQRRLETEREALRERTQLLAQAEQAREALQEQLRRRSEELAKGQKVLSEQLRQYEVDAAALESRRQELEREQQEATARVAEHLRQMEARAAQLQQQSIELAQQQQQLQVGLAQLREQEQQLAAQQQALAQEQAQVEAERTKTQQAAAQARAEFEEFRKELLELQRQLPDLELRAGTAFERLSSARELLREHINEMHAYARQCQEELDGLRSNVQHEVERLQSREQQLRRSQDEHRLAVVAFRQQLIDWQGQVAEIRRLLSQDETRLERRQAEVAEQARQVDQESSRLASKAADLQQQEREVQEQRQEVAAHLNDMREWYRRKLRELAGVMPSAEPDPEATTESSTPLPGRDILSLTGPVDSGDRQLGELLRSLGLVEAETLTTLLAESRRQRRSLRQVLLASGVITLYQLALIETGNLDALMLGPVRVVDRLQVTPREVVYRVFDPRRGSEAILRHLTEAEMQDAVHPDEYRQRFAQASLSHPNVAGTLEVLEIQGRPAVLQEWLIGLPSSEWPPLAAVPGVWFRLLSQAALGLHTAHQAGLVHGRLQADHFILTCDGLVKLCGLGEPAWLTGSATGEENIADDLAALGEIAAVWAASTDRRRKPLPASLQTILARLTAANPEEHYSQAQALLEDLDQAGGEVPANPEAWERLLRHVREHAVGGSSLRQSA